MNVTVIDEFIPELFGDNCFLLVGSGVNFDRTVFAFYGAFITGFESKIVV